MIREIDLNKLGYTKKSERMLGKHLDKDFHYGVAGGERAYLINLTYDGYILVVHPNNAVNPEYFRTDDLKKFTAWHFEKGSKL